MKRKIATQAQPLQEAIELLARDQTDAKTRRRLLRLAKKVRRRAPVGYGEIFELDIALVRALGGERCVGDKMALVEEIEAMLTETGIY